VSRRSRRGYVSDDLRWEIIVATLEEGMTVTEIMTSFATALRIHRRTVQRIIRTFKKTGHLWIRAHGGGRVKGLGLEHQAWLKETLRITPCMYLHEICDLIKVERGIEVSQSVMARTLYAMNYSYRTMCRIHHSASIASRVHYRLELYRCVTRAEQVLYLDEASRFKRGFEERRRGWGPRGARNVRPLFGGGIRKGQRLNMLGVVSSMGLFALHVTTGGEAYTAHDLTEFIVDEVIPRMGRYSLGEDNSVLVADNARIHNKMLLRQIAEETDIKILFLPTYSPFLNPIETYWSWLRKAFEPKASDHGQVVDSLECLATAIRAIDGNDMPGVYTTCGIVFDDESGLIDLTWKHPQ